MEFPRHMHKPGGQFVVVTNEEQYERCEATGWSDRPAAHVEQPVEVRIEDAVKGSEDAPPAVVAPKKKGKK